MNKAGRFVIDTHVHAQRHAAGHSLKEKQKASGKKGDFDYIDLDSQLPTITTYDNSPRLLYDMECYGVDMCILQSAFGMNNDINVDLVKRYPDKFRAMAFAKTTMDAIVAGEKEWDMKDAIEELDGLLSSGMFCAIGEGAPAIPETAANLRRYSYNLSNRMDELRLVMDLARKHKVPVTMHTGTGGGYPITHSRWPEDWHPYWIMDLAAEYPDVTIIFSHGGMQGGYCTDLVEQCLTVASNFNNVYLETGLYWTDLYYKALRYPNVGPEKLIWGTDWGASLPVQTHIGQKPQTFAMQVHKQGIIKHQCDIMGWSLRQVERLDISQDDMNLILGGNALNIFKINYPLTRMFKGLPNVGR